MCIHFELVAVSLFMRCWAEYLSWEPCGLKRAALKEPKLDCSCLFIVFSANSVHLELITMGTSDRVGN